MEIQMNNTNNNHVAILDSTFYFSEERENGLINTMWDADLHTTRAHEDALCHTLTHEGECECEQKSADPSDYYPIHGQEYHGMLHDIAIKAFWKSTTETSLRGDEVFNLALRELDKMEAVYTPGTHRVFRRRLPYKQYQYSKALRARINLFRWDLYVLTYEQWAYLTNYLNVLTSYVHLTGEHKGEIKQYDCKMQNVVGNCTNKKETEEKPEDNSYEIIAMWYTRD